MSINPVISCKRMIAISAIALVLFVYSSHTHAIPVYYTFEGTVYNSNDIQNLNPDGLAYGSTVSYTIMVDQDLDGYYLRNDGSSVTYSDTADRDFFYAEYIGGSEVPLPYLLNMQFFYASMINDQSFYSLTVGNGLTLENITHIDNWVVGTTFNAVDTWQDLGITYSIHSNVSLVEVSNTNPYANVPETASLLLLSYCLLGLGFIHRKRITII